MASFIETQFPVSKLSKESYKERKARNTQTLTSLGKWWGRKPLILVRATIIGLLMPASNDPKKDREIFLKILTMDEDGLYQRKSKPIALKDVYGLLCTSERKEWFEPTASETLPKLKEGTTAEDRQILQKIAFNRLSYDDKLTYCDRPEQIEGPSEEAWVEINAHLGTTANSLPELVQQLGEKQFGHTPSVGDAFCGGGSVPFEAARIGCEAYGSDLNPVASLLTWAALNIVGGGEEVAEQVRQAQEKVYKAVDHQITEWGIEHNENGWRADAYLYCSETKCPECSWMVPLAPGWVIGERTRCIGILKPDPINQRFDIQIKSDVSASEMAAAKATGTVRNSSLICPNESCQKSTPIEIIRGDRHKSLDLMCPHCDQTLSISLRGKKGISSIACPSCKQKFNFEIKDEKTIRYGLRQWEKDDLIPRHNDVLQERLYCIRWVKTYVDAKGKERTERYYRAPNQQDFDREAKVLGLLQERFDDWQEKGYIPSRQIEPGDETTRLQRERGWTHWHHLFNPRQLLILGTLAERVTDLDVPIEQVSCLLSLWKCADYNAKLSQWDPTPSKEMVVHTFANQAFNTFLNYGSRGLLALDTSWFFKVNQRLIHNQGKVLPSDSRTTPIKPDIGLTDPPYADAINYHELSEFFLAW